MDEEIKRDLDLKYEELVKDIKFDTKDLLNEKKIERPDYRVNTTLTAEQIAEIRKYYRESVVSEDSVGSYDDDFRYKNWKIRRYDHEDVPVMEFSNLEGTWMVRVPYDCETYNLANLMRALKERNEIVDVYLTNLMTLSMIPNGYLHEAVMMLMMAYVNPSLVSDTMFPNKAQRTYRRDWKAVMKLLVAWGKEREEMMATRDVNVDQEYWRQRAENIMRDDDPETDELIAEAERKRKLMEAVDNMAKKEEE